MLPCWLQSLQAPSGCSTYEQGEPSRRHGKMRRWPSAHDHEIVHELLPGIPARGSCGEADAAKRPQQDLHDLTPQAAGHGAMAHFVAKHREEQQELVANYLSGADPDREVSALQRFDELENKENNGEPTDTKRGPGNLASSERAILGLLGTGGSEFLHGAVGVACVLRRASFSTLPCCPGRS